MADNNPMAASSALRLRASLAVLLLLCHLPLVVPGASAQDYYYDSSYGGDSSLPVVVSDAAVIEPPPLPPSPPAGDARIQPPSLTAQDPELKSSCQYPFLFAGETYVVGDIKQNIFVLYTLPHSDLCVEANNKKHQYIPTHTYFSVICIFGHIFQEYY